MPRHQLDRYKREWRLITLVLAGALFVWISWSVAIVAYIVLISIPEYLAWREKSKPEDRNAD
jgi:phage shock protein PspC (stress-responsive transcriptional regulator)